MTVEIGDIVELEVTKVANGGFCIARHEGQVVFVRHTLPGERVRAEITDITKKFLRADTVEVIAASEHRTIPPCDYAGVCGGCDWQHVNLAHQRELKSAIVREQLGHFAKIHTVNGQPLEEFRVQAMSSGEDGLRWRTRNRFRRIGDLGVGLQMARSHATIEIDDCLIAAEGAVALAQSVLGVGDGDIQTVVTSAGKGVVVDPRNGPIIDEEVFDRRWHIHAASFWQIHKRAPEIFVETVRDMANLQPDETLLDLYSGAGLFAASLAKDVGDDGEVIAVESGIDAVRDARRSCSDLPQLDLITADVTKWLAANSSEKFDVIVLDPPRAGAGLANIATIAAMADRAIVYVACEPSALTRDTAMLIENGWRLTRLRGFDAFPMTSHVECIALFTR
jgi:tRNA/tmRNA/rRNA uracil-C5-methylase (TrmA/RlmC/RlmD family)